MLCPNCGHFSTTDTTVCGLCGKLLPRVQSRDTGVRAIRQGKRARLAAQEGVPPVTGEQPVIEGRTYVDASAVSPSMGTEPIYAAPEIFDADGQPVSGGMHRRSSLINDEPRYIPQPPSSRKVHPVQKRMVNWAKVLVAVAVLFLGGIIGVGMFLTRTASGQRIMARAGFDTTSTAMWEVGDERMDIGDIDGAIAYYTKAA